MAYSEHLADRVRSALKNRKKIEEKKMFGGMAFMVQGKMCIGIVKDELMLRVGPEAYEAALQRNGCREMDFTGKPMKGFVFVDSRGMNNKKDFDYWINLALDFNKVAKASKKRA